MHERRAKGHGHVVAAVAVAIAGIIVILGALNLRADDEPLQNRIFVVHGPDQVAQAHGGSRNMNATHPPALSKHEDRASFIFIRHCVDSIKFPRVVDDEREGW